ncbi:hypothetical protein GCM10010218_38910 [Streptomyces mashuensis]|uniref:Tr-type G domain-containing protein n=1 Tax=Streptomyces mashuensis TaxID=33904 RepID=A0A919EE10_9ACTN|nr:GTP-binding protein [Streptomyces mashuensis]GHF53637.1 hypothetical protein GCM10010218_38910 [Streptomyces mashuensis]
MTEHVPGTDRAYVTVSTVGSAGHGKTTLATAVGKAAAKAYRQDARAVDGIVEAVSRTDEHVATHSAHSAYVTAACHYTHFDASAGHVAELLGNTRLDAVVLVVSAAEGVTEQTREHLRLARRAGVPVAAVFLTMCDRLGDGDAGGVEKSVREVLDAPDVPVIQGSPLKALSGHPAWEAPLVELLEAMDAFVAAPAS